MYRIFSLISLIFISFTSVNADVTNVFEFTNSELSKLEVRKVRGADNKTIYSIGSNENGNYLKAVADNAASGLGKEINIDLNKTPFINITWKIERDLKGIKENTKKGHDFAARVFVIKKTGATVLSNRAINYVFSSNNGVGFNSPSPYTKKSIDYLKQSAELGYMKAEEDLGAAYMNGNGVPKDRSQAKKWLKNILKVVKTHQH